MADVAHARLPHLRTPEGLAKCRSNPGGHGRDQRVERNPDTKGRFVDRWRYPLRVVAGSTATRSFRGRKGGAGGLLYAMPHARLAKTGQRTQPLVCHAQGQPCPWSRPPYNVTKRRAPSGLVINPDDTHNTLMMLDGTRNIPARKDHLYTGRPHRQPIWDGPRPVPGWMLLLRGRARRGRRGSTGTRPGTGTVHGAAGVVPGAADGGAGRLRDFARSDNAGLAGHRRIHGITGRQAVRRLRHLAACVGAGRGHRARGALRASGKRGGDQQGRDQFQGGH